MTAAAETKRKTATATTRRERRRAGVFLSNQIVATLILVTMCMTVSSARLQSSRTLKPIVDDSDDIMDTSDENDANKPRERHTTVRTRTVHKITPAASRAADHWAAHTSAHSDPDDELDDDYYEDDEDEFYAVNPVDQATRGWRTNAADAIRVNDSDFNDFDDHTALRTVDFYSTSDAADNRHKQPPAPSAASANIDTDARAAKLTTTRAPGRAAEPSNTTIMGGATSAKNSEASATQNKQLRKQRMRDKEKKKKREKFVARDHYVASAQTVLGSPPDECALPIEPRATALVASATPLPLSPMVGAGGAYVTCVTYAMVEWAVERARRALRFRAPADLMATEPSEASINAVGELNELTTRLLAARLRLNAHEIAYGLERINVQRTSLYELCPGLMRLPMACESAQLSRYRSHTGQCNNLFAGHLGSSDMPFVRFVPPEYADQVGLPRRSPSSGAELPPPRLLALALHPDMDDPLSDEHSNLFMSWGQLINHDMAMASPARDSTGHTGACCGPVDGRAARTERVCMPIQIAPDDPVYGAFQVRCHEFKRSLAALRPGCSLGPRTQLNTVSSYVDASFVYGSHRSASAALRNAGARGELRTWNYFRRQQLKPLLPAQVQSPDLECVRRPADLYCFQSGDSRTNQHVQLVALHTVHTRQHNRLAQALSQLNPHWTAEHVYHEARHIHVAIVQHILLAEYLPALLGDKYVADMYNLTEASADAPYWDSYDPQVNAGVSQEFAAAAFRQGHTRVPPFVHRFDAQHHLVRSYRLRELYRQPWPLFEPGAMDEFLRGTLDAPAADFDPFVSQELSGHLLEEPGARVGLDLVAINIQRGRDQGLAGYNAFRDWCGMKRVTSFDQLERDMDKRSVDVLAQLYESVDDIDLFTGGLAEQTRSGAQLGPTFACIIARQFEAVRTGDRYWFETSAFPQAFTPPQLSSIKQVSLARVICANSDFIVDIQPLALKLPHPVYNPRQLCAQLPDVDIALWFEPRPAAGAAAAAAGTVA